MVSKLMGIYELNRLSETKLPDSRNIGTVMCSVDLRPLAIPWQAESTFCDIIMDFCLTIEI